MEEAILAGPPREMYRDDLEEELWQGLVAHSVWLHLAKLSTSGLVLGTAAALRLAELSSANPQWQLATNDRDEFSHWMSGTGDPDFEDSQEVEIAPRKRQDLVQWLRHSEPQKGPFNEDTWSEVCRTRFFHSALALGDLAQEKIWPTERWRKALQTWAENGMVLRSWRYVAPLVQTMPDETIKELQHALTWWLEVVSKSLNRHENILLALCSRILELPLDAGPGSHIIRNGEEIYDPVSSAINHPIGHVTQTLINLWFKQNPNDNDLLPVDLQPLFTSLCDVQVERYRHGRVLLGSRLIAFFRVDRPWTEQYLLPLLSWTNPIEAKGVWEGFLWSPRLYQPLLAAFKPQFLDSANHYVDLGEHRQQFATFLTYAALGQIEGYSVEELRSAIGVLPQEGLEKSVVALFQALEGAADQREDYWKHRVQPFWQKIWPKSRELATPRIAETLVRLVIATRGEFPAAVAMVKDWLQPIEHPYYVLHKLHESGLCKQFPAEALQLLNLVIFDDVMGLDQLRSCLQEIVLVEPNLEHDYQYLRINELLRRRGM
ncbi:hypothetical protein [Aeromonas veronii]|uniref:hypothetical protein n=1 Tax=Aeromonas veronii TaxID=654 RepID=UPI003BA17810